MPPSILLLPVKHQVPLLLHLALDPSKNLVGEPRKPKWFRDVRQLDALQAKEFAVRVYGAGKPVREPVERDVGEDVVEGGVFVGPFEELFGDPKQVRWRVSFGGRSVFTMLIERAD